MAANTVVKVTSRGMITIPLMLRKKYDLKEGSKIAILEDEGKMCLIPLADIEELRKDFPSLEEFASEIDRANLEELELEK
jgi:AbrB family looped-hinge helix DNA binding protein